MSHQAAIHRGKLKALTFVGAVAIGGALGTVVLTSGAGTANATDCGWAHGGLSVSGGAVADCDGIQNGQMSGSTKVTDGYGVDGQGGQAAGQGMEDSDGTTGDICGANPDVSLTTVQYSGSC